jgi:activator of HSP90 ATPase
VPDLMSRRDMTVRLTALCASVGLPRSAFALANTDEISRTNEAIHQEAAIGASRQRVYAALTDAAQFTRLTTFTDIKDAPPAQIAREVGGAFSLFGGHIVGRHVELVPSQRIVQAWRAADWEAGVYSIARFELKENGAQTTIVFDHTGFPNGRAQSLADGWKSHYWEPLKKLLA